MGEGVTDLKVVDHDGEGDAVGTEVLLHRAQARAWHPDIDGELG